MSAGLVEVLDAHSLHSSMNVCLCGEWRARAGAGSLAGQHRTHVAEQIVAAGFGPVREAEAALADLRASVEALESRWSAALDDGCPSCGPVGFTDCDHIEGYHHALSDLRALLAQQGGE